MPPTHLPARPPARPTKGPHRQNQGWGKLIFGIVFGVAGALWQALPGAVAGVTVGVFLGHWFDKLGEPDPAGGRPVPKQAGDIELEDRRQVAAEVAEVFAALDRQTGKSAVSDDQLRTFLWQQLRLSEVPKAGRGFLPWQQDLASACQRVAERLSPPQKHALVTALYRHANLLGLPLGPTRLVLRDGVAALGISESEEERLR